jgi:high-affinity K+ transport system ATPase subunit B
MALFKVILKKGDSVSIEARDYFPLDGYTIFQTGEIKEIAIETKFIDGIEDITGNSGQFLPRQILPADE